MRGRTRGWRRNPSKSVAGLLVLSLAGFSLVGSAGAGASKVVQAAALPLTTCATKYGVTEPTNDNAGVFPASGLPKSLRREFGLYTDSKRTMTPLLAPRGWHCDVVVGANGSASFDMYASKKEPGRSRYSNTPQVIAITDGACQTCVADNVCPYFSNAVNQIGVTGLICPARKPNSEQVNYVLGTAASSAGLVTTYDPANSKSKYASYGVLRYALVTGSGGQDAREFCVLPAKEASWCKPITKEFISNNWEFGPITHVATTTTVPPTTVPAPPPTTIPAPVKVAPTTSTVVTTPTLGSNAQFIADAVASIPGITDAVNAGVTTPAFVGEYGDNICTLLPEDARAYGSGTAAYAAIANEFIAGDTYVQLSPSDATAFVSLAIAEICPSYVNDIPAGEPSP